MAFSSYDDLISEITAGKRLVLPWSKTPTTAPIAANFYHLWTVGGMPGVGVYGGTDLAFQRTIDTRAGALYSGGNKAADTKHLIYMNALVSAGATPPYLMLVDMVGYYPILSLSSVSQNFDNTTAPDRYNSAGQSGLQIMMVNTALGAVTATNLTVLTYVDQDGNTGATIPTTPTNTLTVSAAAPTATLGSRQVMSTGNPFLPLATGDMGVRSLTNVTFGVTAASASAFLLVKPLATIPCPTALIPGERDLVMQIANLERVFDGACLCWIAFFAVATGATFIGQVDVAWG